jgi:hypothetical protein
VKAVSASIGNICAPHRVVDGKGYDHVVMIKIDVERGAGRDCPNDKEGKEQENDSEQVTKGKEVLAYLCLRTVHVVCFLRGQDVFKIR